MKAGAQTKRSKPSLDIEKAITEWPVEEPLVSIVDEKSRMNPTFFIDFALVGGCLFRFMRLRL